MKRILSLLFLVLLNMLLGAGYSRAAVDVHGARFWESPEKARFVFDLSAPVKYAVAQFNKEILLTIKKAKLDAALPVLRSDNKYALGIKQVSEQGDAITFSINTPGPMVANTFLLGPAGPYGHRLVLDVSLADEVQDASLVVEKKKSIKSIKSLLSDPEQDKIAQTPSVSPGKTWLIAIDPGHGGEDPGAVGPDGAYEKNVTLAIARDLARRISQTPGMKAYLTRDGDYFVTLWDRTKKARRMGADLFVSIHADASPGSTAHGASVYTLSRKGASDQAAAMLANKENQADLVGGVKIADKDAVLASVLLDLSQTAAISASQTLASNILQQLSDIGHLHREHFGEARFVVLKSPDIPSVLVETGFITHPDEERLLTSPEYQERIADAIFRGIGQYVARFTRTVMVTPPARHGKAGKGLPRRSAQKSSRSIAAAMD